MTEIKVGDFIRVKGGRNIVKVSEVCDGRYGVSGKQTFHTIYADSDGLERLDPKTAFLTELKELLARYNASLGASSFDPLRLSLDVYIGDDCVVSYDMDYDREGYKGYITADNIIDYDKE